MNAPTLILMDVDQHAGLPFPRSLREFQRLFPGDAACATRLPWPATRRFDRRRRRSQRTDRSRPDQVRRKGPTPSSIARWLASCRRTGSGRRRRVAPGSLGAADTSRTASTVEFQILSQSGGSAHLNVTVMSLAFQLQNRHVDQIEKEAVIGMLHHAAGNSQFNLNQLQVTVHLPPPFKRWRLRGL